MTQWPLEQGGPRYRERPEQQGVVHEHSPGCRQLQPQEQYSWLFHNGLELTTAQCSENEAREGTSMLGAPLSQMLF